MNLHKEISFETEICDTLSAQGWLYVEGDAPHYDRARALFPADVITWVQESQPKAWEALSKNHGASAETVLLGRLQNHLIAPVLGISDPRRDKRIDFIGGIRSLEELERRVDSGEMAVADANEVMPPKSTWFEPKLADGLVSLVLD